MHGAPTRPTPVRLTGVVVGSSFAGRRDIMQPGIPRGAREFSIPRDESHHCSGG
jgi:hypothetical protein